MMKRQSDRHLIRHQKSLVYYVDHNVDVDIMRQARDTYARRFIADASLAVMPIGGRSRRRDFEVELVPKPTPTVLDLIVQGFGARLYTCRVDLASTVSEFVRQSAATICASDRANYEVVYLEEFDAKRLTGFELVPVPEEQLLRRRGRLFQIVPPEIAHERGTQTEIAFDAQDIATIEAPLRFREGLQKVRSGLSRLGQFRLPGLLLDANQDGIPYDFKVHERAMKLALFDVVRPIGWNAGGDFNDCVLSYCRIQREILFEEFKIELREAILAGVNEVLRRVGGRLGFDVQLRVGGLPTFRDTEEARRKMVSGEVAFTDVMDAFRLG